MPTDPDGFEYEEDLIMAWGGVEIVKTVSRGTSNTNDRGSARDRTARKRWLLETFRADRDVSVSMSGGDVQEYNPRLDACGYTREAACRCYRCGRLLSLATLTVDRIIPGCKGGTYRRNNIRPACGLCNSITGNMVRTYRPMKATK